MKKNKIIHISDQEYQIYLSLFGRNVSIPGFRSGHIPSIMLHNRIGEGVINYISQHKINDLLKNYKDVSDVKFKHKMNGLSVEIEVEFNGTEQETKQDNNEEKKVHVHDENCKEECSESNADK